MVSINHNQWDHDSNGSLSLFCTNCSLYWRYASYSMGYSVPASSNNWCYVSDVRWKSVFNSIKHSQKPWCRFALLGKGKDHLTCQDHQNMYLHSIHHLLMLLWTCSEEDIPYTHNYMSLQSDLSTVLFLSGWAALFCASQYLATISSVPINSSKDVDSRRNVFVTGSSIEDELAHNFTLFRKSSNARFFCLQINFFRDDLLKPNANCRSSRPLCLWVFYEISTRNIVIL